MVGHRAYILPGLCWAGRSLAAAWQLELKPQATLLEQGAFFLVENLGHVLTQRPTAVLPLEHVQSTGLTFCAPPAEFDSSQDLRCRIHTRETLGEIYDLPDNEETISMLDRVFQDGNRVLVVFDMPFPLPAWIEPSMRSFFASVKGLASRQHTFIGQRAHAMRYGAHPYPRCTETCSPTSCVHKHRLHLPWVLEPLWSSGGPKTISMVNIGCRDFGPGDPLATFLGSEVTLSGLCVEKDRSMLAEAGMRLAGHKVETVEMAVTPRNVKAMLDEHGVSSVDIFQLDIDCFEISILDVVLAEVEASVVILELIGFPPPFRFAAHYSSKFDLPRHYHPELEMRAGTGKHCGLTNVLISYSGASLSYLVEFMGRRGYWLYKMNHMDHIWIHQKFAPAFAARDEDLRFPIDEWACWMDLTSLLPSEGRPQDLRRYSLDWFLLPDLNEAFERIWDNLTCLAEHVGLPFTLDLP